MDPIDKLVGFALEHGATLVNHHQFGELVIAARNDRIRIITEANRQIQFYQDLIRTIQAERDNAQTQRDTLLESCKAMLEIYQDTNVAHRSEYERDIAEKCRAAIAKAEKT